MIQTIEVPYSSNASEATYLRRIRPRVMRQSLMALSNPDRFTDKEKQPYKIHISDKYLDLTRQKLKLTRLPRGLNENPKQYSPSSYDSKERLEILLDFWLEEYDWRAEETFYNEKLPQYRVLMQGSFLHFVHKRSHLPDAVPLLYVHGWPDSFIGVVHIINDLCHPSLEASAEQTSVPSFHVVAPSIPGFAFSNPIREDKNNMQGTATTLNSLMKKLGYDRYIAHGIGW